MTKLAWIDVETTGLLAYVNDVIQLAGLIEIDGEVLEEFSLQLAPINVDKIQQSALDVNNKTRQEILSYPDPLSQVLQFTDLLAPYLDKTDKKDKFIFAGYNAPFDKDFVQNLFKRVNIKGFNTLFEYKTFDVYTLVFILTYCGKIPKLEDMKLATMAKYFNIEHDAHEALSDIKATREVFLKCIELMN